ncbi:hypothetical protein BAY61_02450 [Prauserella marina]|nr:hypothetical protein BAY61_02450 [Prauserella marina]
MTRALFGEFVDCAVDGADADAVLVGEGLAFGQPRTELPGFDALGDVVAYLLPYVFRTAFEDVAGLSGAVEGRAKALGFGCPVEFRFGEPFFAGGRSLGGCVLADDGPTQAARRTLGTRQRRRSLTLHVLIAVLWWRDCP